jgi:DNA-binding XRE family transcriptional regulator
MPDDTRSFANDEPQLTARVIRAARALLGLSQDELASRAEIARRTLVRIESDADWDGGSDPRRAQNTQKLRQVLEDAGVEFITATSRKGEGVRLARP